MAVSKLKKLRESVVVPSVPAETMSGWIEQYTTYLRSECHLADVGHAIGNRDTRQTGAFSERIPPNVCHALANRHVHDAGTAPSRKLMASYCSAMFLSQAPCSFCEGIAGGSKRSVKIRNFMGSNLFWGEHEGL